MGFAWFILIGIFTGWAAGDVMKSDSFGLLGDVVVGVIGASLGGFLSHAAGMNLGSGFAASIIVALLGSVFLLLALRLLSSTIGWGRGRP